MLRVVPSRCGSAPTARSAASVYWSYTWSLTRAEMSMISAVGAGSASGASGVEAMRSNTSGSSSGSAGRRRCPASLSPACLAGSRPRRAPGGGPGRVAAGGLAEQQQEAGQQRGGWPDDPPRGDVRHRDADRAQGEQHQGGEHPPPGAQHVGPPGGHVPGGPGRGLLAVLGGPGRGALAVLGGAGCGALAVLGGPGCGALAWSSVARAAVRSLSPADRAGACSMSWTSRPGWANVAMASGAAASCRASSARCRCADGRSHLGHQDPGPDGDDGEIEDRAAQRVPRCGCPGTPVGRLRVGATSRVAGLLTSRTVGARAGR